MENRRNGQKKIIFFFLSKSILLCHLPSPGLLRKLGSGDFPYFLHGAYFPNTENVLVFPILTVYMAVFH